MHIFLRIYTWVAEVKKKYSKDICELQDSFTLGGERRRWGEHRIFSYILVIIILVILFFLRKYVKQIYRYMLILDKFGWEVHWCLCIVPWKCWSLSHVRLFATPWIVAHQAPLSMEFSRQEYWSSLLFPSPGDIPDLESKPRSPALQADSLLSEPPGKHCSLYFWVFCRYFMIKNNNYDALWQTGWRKVWVNSKNLGVFFQGWRY